MKILLVGLSLALFCANACADDSCICEGLTNRVAMSSQTKVLLTGLDSWWIDLGRWLVEKRFLRNSVGGLILFVR